MKRECRSVISMFLRTVGIFFMLFVAAVALAQANTQSGAFTISTFTGYLDAANTEDTWEFTIASDGEVTFSLTFDPTLDPHYLTIYDSDGSSLIATCYVGPSPTPCGPLALKAGTFHVNVGRFDGYGGYTLQNTYTVQPLANDAEPNDDYPHAGTLSLNVSNTGHLGYVGGGTAKTDMQDWWKFTMASDGEITFSLTFDLSLDPHYLTIYDSDGSSVIATCYIGPSPTPCGPLGLKAGTFYVSIGRFGGYGGYILQSTYTAQPLANDTEPNDDYLHAGTLSLDNSDTGHLGYVGGGTATIDTQDWWKFTMASDGEITFSLTFDLTLDPHYLSIYDSDGSSVIATCYIGESPTPCGPLGLKAGTFYVHIGRFGGYGGYTLQKTYTAQPLANDPEPNDDYLHARNLSLNSTRKGHLGYVGGGTVTTDVQDWWKFAVASDGEITFSLTFDPTLDPHYLSIYDSDGSSLIATCYIGESPTPCGPYGLEAGPYYVSIFRFGGYGGYILQNTYAVLNAPVVDGQTPTKDTTPAWTWTSGGGGNGTFRYKLDDSDLTLGATQTTATTYTPVTALAPGAHTLYVQERNATAQWSDSGSKTIVIDTAMPVLGAVTPTPVTTEQGKAQTFTAVYSNADGVINFKTVEMLATAETAGTANGIRVQYKKSLNKLYLYNNSGSALAGTCTPGETKTVSNSQGSLNCEQTKKTVSGNDLTMKWSITPKAVFAGTKKLKTKATDLAGNATAWEKKGSWTIIAANTKPALGTLTPSKPTTAANAPKNFTAVYSDTDGHTNLRAVELLITTDGTTANAIWVKYDKNTKKLSLYNGPGTAVAGSCSPGQAKVLTNTQGSLNCAAVTITPLTTDLSVKWNITPKFTGLKQIRMKATDNSYLTTGWVRKGTWTITAAAPSTFNETDNVYAVFRYGARDGEPYIYQEEAAMEGMEQDILIGVAEDAEEGPTGPSELAIAIRKAGQGSPVVSGSYKVIEQSAATELYEYTFDGQGTLEIGKRGLVIERLPYAVEQNGRMTVGGVTGQIKADGSVFVLSGSADNPAIIIGTKAGEFAAGGTFEGIEVINLGNRIQIAPKVEVLGPHSAVSADGQLILDSDTDPDNGDTGFILLLRKK